jgi:hypothetical protein
VKLGLLLRFLFTNIDILPNIFLSFNMSICLKTPGLPPESPAYPNRESKQKKLPEIAALSLSI